MELQEIIDRARKLVFFSGAGVSTESGIPDFRSQDGLYHQQYAYDPEVILSRSFFDRRPEEFFRFYRDKLLVSSACPNPAHIACARLEQAGKMSGVVTQNIDGLHTDAGSRTVFELHGCVRRNFCMDCGRFYDDGYIRRSEGVPRCACGGIVKSDVVLYEEPLDEQVMLGAIRAIEAADVMVVAGTSLAVYPAAGLLRYFRGDRLVVINKTATPADASADLVLRGPVGQVMGALRI